jgi:hypothetical protein
MEELAISRGNAHTNLKELVAWGLVRVVVRKGERREYFEAEKDVWKIFTTWRGSGSAARSIPRWRCSQAAPRTAGRSTPPEGRAFYDQMRQLEEFVEFASVMADRIASMKHGFALQMAAKLLG